MNKAELVEKEMKYNTGEEEVKLTINIVRNMLARGNTSVTDQEAMAFMQLCRYRKLNPFLNEAYLVKYGKDAQIIVGKEAFMRRAEENEKYKGHRAGVIVQREDKILELEGSFKLPNDILLGGWAMVEVEGKKYPVTARVAVDEYLARKKDGTVNEMWSTKTMTMIRKVAIVQAMREAFPTTLSGMHIEDEMRESIKTPKDITEKSKLEKEMEEAGELDSTNIQDAEYEEVDHSYDDK